MRQALSIMRYFYPRQIALEICIIFFAPYLISGVASANDLFEKAIKFCSAVEARCEKVICKSSALEANAFFRDSLDQVRFNAETIKSELSLIKKKMVESKIDEEGIESRYQISQHIAQLEQNAYELKSQLTELSEAPNLSKDEETLLGVAASSKLFEIGAKRKSLETELQKLSLKIEDLKDRSTKVDNRIREIEASTGVDEHVANIDLAIKKIQHTSYVTNEIEKILKKPEIFSLNIEKQSQSEIRAEAITLLVRAGAIRSLTLESTHTSGVGFKITFKEDGNLSFKLIKGELDQDKFMELLKDFGFQRETGTGHPTSNFKLPAPNGRFARTFYFLRNVELAE